MASDMNPLKQYFRRPAVYIKLPSNNKFYKDGVIENTPNGELPVYPMTAIDEITMKTPDALFNGVAMAELIKSCVPNIKDPWAINNIDFDAILIGIKIADGKNEMEVESTCPACGETNGYGINLTNLLGSMSAGDFDKEMKMHDLAIKIKPITFKQMNEAAISQLSIQKQFIEIENEQDPTKQTEERKKILKELTKLTMEILTESIEYIQTPTIRVDNKEFILDFLENCEKSTYVEIRDYNAKLKENSEIKPLQIKCPNCGNEYKQPFTLNVSDFFA
jgi:predicted RNA-binding Zn-ribbon protein involved in translation (DUF1610 family)